MRQHRQGIALYLAIGAALLAVAPAALAADRDCSHFDTQDEAQRFFGGAGAGDPHGLDGDGDGIACESLPAGGGGTGGGRRAGGQDPSKRRQVIDARIVSVVDGDTVRVRAFGARRSRYTVRLLGIDTPESRRPGTPVECCSRRATAYLRRLALRRGRGRPVTLTTDPTQDLFDRYDRLLAYVKVRQGAHLNFSQVRAGWAKVYVFRRRFQRYRSFTRAQRAVRREGAGVWDRCGGRFHAPASAAAAARLSATARAARVARRVSANLDGDRRRERVELVARTRPNPYGGTAPIPVRYVRVIDWRRDGRVMRRITPKVEYASFRVRDFNADGRKEVWFSGGAGSGGRAPRWFGLYQWSGRRSRALWFWSSRTSTVANRWAGAAASWSEWSGEHPGRELVLDEGVLSPGDPYCCPSRIRVSVYAYSSRAKRYLLFDRFYTTP